MSIKILRTGLEILYFQQEPLESVKSVSPDSARTWKLLLNCSVKSTVLGGVWGHWNSRGLKQSYGVLVSIKKSSKWSRNSFNKEPRCHLESAKPVSPDNARTWHFNFNFWAIENCSETALWKARWLGVSEDSETREKLSKIPDCKLTQKCEKLNLNWL